MSSLSLKEWLDIATLVGIVALAIDRWVHGREKTEDQHGHEISRQKEITDRIEREYKVEVTRLWVEIDRIHEKASDMSSEFQTRGGELSTDLAVLKEIVTSLQRVMDRRSTPR